MLALLRVPGRILPASCRPPCCPAPPLAHSSRPMSLASSASHGRPKQWTPVGSRHCTRSWSTGTVPSALTCLSSRQDPKSSWQTLTRPCSPTSLLQRRSTSTQAAKKTATPHNIVDVSARHPALSTLRRLVNEPQRKREKVLCIEGKRLLTTALEAQWKPACIVVTQEFLPDVCALVDASVPIKVAGDTVLRAIMRQEHLEPVMAYGPQPQRVPPRAPRRGLVLCGQDPQNTGCLIRTATAFGFDVVYCAPTAVDPFNPQSLRSSAGTAIAMAYGSYEAALAQARAGDVTVLRADAHGGLPLASAGAPAQRLLLVLGHETEGVPPEWADLGTSVSIPIAGVESLSVVAAGAVLMHALRAVSP
eukprot:m.59311 g.59311  ORF g.59311 m.59311 type:complete len:362 (+) comp6955_c0_seq1:69-1154(+)